MSGIFLRDGVCAHKRKVLVAYRLWQSLSGYWRVHNITTSLRCICSKCSYLFWLSQHFTLLFEFYSCCCSSFFCTNGLDIIWHWCYLLLRFKVLYLLNFIYKCRPFLMFDCYFFGKFNPYIFSTMLFVCLAFIKTSATCFLLYNVHFGFLF